MGLDQYLRAKTTKREYKGPTGACSGIFPIAPEDHGMVEIGYWRKAYDQDMLISQMASSHYDDNDDLRILPEEVDAIINKVTDILATHTFDEEGYDLDNDDNPTWQSKRKWEDTLEFFQEAKKILEEDPEAEIYYHIWY
jgi:hypothetical protein